jgi:uncharacterized protein
MSEGKPMKIFNILIMISIVFSITACEEKPEEDPHKLTKINLPPIEGPSRKVMKQLKQNKFECKKGDAQACYNLGSLYDSGKDLKKNAKKARKFYRKAAIIYKEGCEVKKNLKYCIYLSYLYEMGKGVKKNPKKFMKINNDVCNKGDGEACFNLGKSYEKGINGVKKSLREASRLYKLSCDKGDTGGCKKSVLLNKKKASIYIKNCKKGKMEYCEKVGLSYFNGLGVTRSYVKALKYFKKACEKGNKLSCVGVGIIYGEGLEVLKEYKKAEKILGDLCTQGSGIACNELGKLIQKSYRKLKKTIGNIKKAQQNKEFKILFKNAEKYFTLACNFNSAEGCANLGEFNDLPNKLYKSPNFKKAGKFYKKGCELECKKTDYTLKKSSCIGVSKSCVGLAQLFRRGEQGIKQDLNAALELFKRACKKGMSEACFKSKTLESEINQ